MNPDKARQRTSEYFSEKLEAFGATPKGVDYNGSESQALRFEQLAKVIDPSTPFTLVDYGCGYGAMFDFLQIKGWVFEYYGIDFIEKMAVAGREAHKDFANSHFTVNESDLPTGDYLLAGAIFNNKFEASDEEWQELVTSTLRRMDALCSKGFSFNMLTKYSDEDRKAARPDLFYGDPLFFFDYCKRNFSRNVALLHDYGLYDFTVVVRKGV